MTTPEIVTDPTDAWVTIEVAVRKEAENEAEDWTPPTAREVADFVEGLTAGRETDDGWEVNICRSLTDADGRLDGWHKAGVEVDYRWHLFIQAKTPLDQAQALTDLAFAMYDLRTYLPGYDYNNNTLPWRGEDES